MSRSRTRLWRCAWAATVLVPLWASPARAVNVVVDYGYDSSNFFPVGSPARATIEAVASYYSGILADTFSSITKPPDFHSAQFSGVAFWDWTMNFTNPSTGFDVELQNPTVAANEYRIYVGGRGIDGPTLGIGGPGGFGWSSNNNGGGFTSGEINQLNQITDTFEDDVERREEASGFASWGGAVTFDASDVTWHFSHATPPTAGTNDFFSVALHEMAHALGFGASDEWSNLAGGSAFAGAAAAAEFGSPPPLEPPNPARGHWRQDTMSRVFGTNTPQQPAMTPSINVGTRKYFTALDAAALVDIGWTVAEPTPPTYHPADFNQNGTVDAADLTPWRNAFGATAAADADGDNDTDGRDFLIWQRSLGATGPAAGAVPEPRGAMLATLFAGTFLLKRRRGNPAPSDVGASKMTSS